MQFQKIYFDIFAMAMRTKSSRLRAKHYVCFATWRSYFFTAFLTLFAIFFSTDSYQISTLTATIAVFESVKIPIVLLRENDNFNGWEKIKTTRIIRESVGTYIERWHGPSHKRLTKP